MGTPPNTPLIDLLGETRAQVVALLHDGRATVAELADALEITPMAVRRHLQALVVDELVEGHTTPPSGPGRPAVLYQLTPRGERLFPDRSSELADDVLTFLHDERGKSEMIAFLRWRQKRQHAHYAGALHDIDGLDARARRLAEMLSEDGFAAEVAADADGYALTQTHCAIKDAAAAYPQLCAFEAALFRELLGAQVTRRETIAGGAPACVCHVTPVSGPQAPWAVVSRAERDEQGQQMQHHPIEPLTTRGVRDGDQG